jgi:catechol 2,3-dioxygenase-like lactoylglutathione lyase family enzyme
MNRPQVFFHLGVLVRDLDQAIGRFGRVLGLTFNEPIVANFARLEDPDPHVSFVRCTYSREGPPYVELLEANGDGLFSIRHGEGFHHIGFWESDPDGRCSALADLDIRPEGRVVNPDGGTFAFFNHPADLYGIRLEVLADASRQLTEDWIRTGVFSGPDSP